jgi:hypothetical protein
MIVTPACLCSIKARTADLNDAFSRAAQFVINFQQTLFGLIGIIFGTLIQHRLISTPPSSRLTAGAWGLIDAASMA